MKTPLIIGHRGASAVLVENTIPALERARADGADGVELDVRLCATGEPVVFHDANLRRMAGRDERIDALSLAELRRVELRGGARIPTLDDVLEALPADYLINVEIKTTRRVPPGVVDAVLPRLRGRNVIVSCFHPAVVWQVRRRAPELPTGLLFYEELDPGLRLGWPAFVLRPTAVHPRSWLLTQARARRWRRAGFAINTWTVDHPAELARVVRCGVDSIIANDPAAARRYVERALKMT